MLVGKSHITKEIISFTQKIAAAAADYPILITGESGVGKTLVARMIHMYSRRKNMPFIQQSCSNIPETLFESELFGYEKGSFTGATTKKTGKVEMANRGTLFLDEVSDLNVQCQAKLLFFMESGKYFRLGGNIEREVNVRIITSSNKDLKEEIRRKKFREDLYYRICTLELPLVPLRERKDDIPLLARHILEIECQKNGMSEITINQEAIDKLIDYEFPGNVRELENIIKRACIICDDGVIKAEDIRHPKLKRDDLNIPDKIYYEMVIDKKTFWEAVHKPFLNRELNRREVRAIINRGLKETNHSFKKLLSLFNIKQNLTEYRRFMKVINVHKLHDKIS